MIAVGAQVQAGHVAALERELDIIIEPTPKGCAGRT